MKTVTVYISLFLLSFFSVSLAPERERTVVEQSNVTTTPVLYTTSSQIPFTHNLSSQSSDSSFQGTPWFGGHGITETVEQIMERERQHPFHYTGIPREPIREHEVPGKEKLPNPEAPDVSQWPPPQDNLKYIGPHPTNPQTIGISFLGPRLIESGFIPPDCNGAAGPTQILVIANGRIKVYDKLGVLGPLNTTTDIFFASVLGGSSTSDCHIRYDRLSGRWFVVMINVSTPNRVLIAVSSSSSIVNSSSFTFFQFQHDLVGPTPNIDTGAFADYPTLGVDRYAMYIGVNMFNPGYAGTTGFVVRKSDLLVNTLTVTAFRGLAVGTGAGPYTPQGVDNDDPAATEGYFIGVDNAVFSLLDIRRITNAGGSPTISGNITLTVPTTYFPLNVPHSGMIAGRLLDALDDRLFAAQLKNGSLWIAHNIRVNASGVAGSTSSFNRDACRWYEIRNLTTSPTLYQSGTLFDPAATNPLFFWIGTTAASGQGHMALCSTIAGATNFAGIEISGRLLTDALGLTEPYTIAQSSSTSYNVQATNPQRWGDFSQVVVDPNDNMTMWTIQEYCDATNSWAERVVQLKAPLPATPTTATSVPPGSPSTNTTVTGTSVNGSGFFDPGTDPGGPGFPNRISASVSGGVTVNSITFNSPTSVTLNVNTTAASNGKKNVTITNGDGQSVTGDTILFVDPALPVLLASFTANVTDGNNVLLTWVTSNEINNSGFEVQRFSSDTKLWNNLGFVDGHGTTNEPKTYNYQDRKLNSGTYSYRLKQNDYNGNFEYFDLTDKVLVGTPQQFSLSQNYPNPSNPVSKIDYNLPVNTKVSLKVYDIMGREVTTLVNEFKPAGYYTAPFDGSNLATGIYIYKLKAGDFEQVKKLALVK